MTERDIKNDLVGLINKLQNDAQQDAEERAQTILLSAMERMSSEVTAERTVTAVKLTDDEMKGRIIGKEGRNIQAMQRATGVDFLVDDIFATCAHLAAKGITINRPPRDGSTAKPADAPLRGSSRLQSLRDPLPFRL